MTIHSRQELADFALRQLGGGIINVEVTDAQLEDCIELAVQHFHEYHFDGIVRDYIVHKITGTQITLSDATNYVVGGKIVSADKKTSATITNVSVNTITINHQIGYDKFVINQAVTDGNLNNPTTITNITLGDIDNGWVAADDNIVGVTKILNITSILGSGDYMFNMQYQIMMTELQALTKAGASMYWQTLNYLGHLDFIMRKEKNYSFNRRQNRLYLEIAWGSDITVGDLVVAEVYRAIDENEYPEVYDDIWLKRYVTALVKKQWGINLSKYTGMQLPGGLTYNGLQIYEQAMTDIQKLEDEALYSTSPLNFEIG